MKKSRICVFFDFFHDLTTWRSQCLVPYWSRDLFCNLTLIFLLFLQRSLFNSLNKKYVKQISKISRWTFEKKYAIWRSKYSWIVECIKSTNLLFFWTTTKSSYTKNINFSFEISFTSNVVLLNSTIRICCNFEMNCYNSNFQMLEFQSTRLQLNFKNACK